jgi:GTPase SAR1 family protein
MTAMPQGAQPRAMRIGIWGAPGSGKTTFLGALNVALARAGDAAGWMMHGVDDTASDFLSESTHRLLAERAFPTATVNSRNLRWRLVRPEHGRRRFLRRTPPPGQNVLELEIMDVAGQLYQSVPASKSMRQPVDDLDDLTFPLADDDPDEQQALLGQLAACDGLIYLYDPTDERPYDYFQRTLEQLSRRMYDGGRVQDGRLPQFLAVCVTKFDDPAVFAQARRAGLTMAGDDPFGPPEIADRDAEHFFRFLCQARGADSAALVLGSINTHFAASRVAYFAVSAIGFYVGPTGRFHPMDYHNLEPGLVEPRIRGEVRPINALAPFVWLDRRLAARPAA